jgi:hypothetical protein
MFLIFLFAFLLSGIRAFILAPFVEFETSEERCFTLLFIYFFITPIGFLAFKKFFSEINNTCTLTILNRDSLKIKYWLYSREINLSQISSVKLVVSPELKSQFNDETLKSLDFSLKYSILPVVHLEKMKKVAH